MAIFNLWLNWAMGFGSLMIPNIVSVYAPAMWVPLVTFAVMGLMILYNQSNYQSRSAICPLIPAIAVRVLFISGVIMVVILLSYSKGIVEMFFDTSMLNYKIPFLTALIISPVVLANALWAHFCGKHYSTCRRCRIGSVERGFTAKIFAQETTYQRYLLIGISGLLTVCSWTYYLLLYVNVNLNVPDKFFLGWMPVIIYLGSVIYLATRYFTIWAYYYQNLEQDDHSSPQTMTLRYLVLSGDNILLTRSDDFSDVPDQASKFDTPAILIYDEHHEVNMQEARQIFTNMSLLPFSDFEIRFMYVSEDSTANHKTIHYIVTPREKGLLEEHPLFRGCKWYNLSQLERLLHNHELSPMLAVEIHRLYTVTMAWKTYDSEGRRLYKVKNYHPVFRLKGIMDWDVDFNSSRWLRVAELNEDKPFYRLRRLLRSRDTDE